MTPPNGIPKHVIGRPKAAMGTHPRSAGFEPRASIFRGACPFRQGRRHRGCHVARWRHPFRQATFIVTVGPSPPSPPSRLRRRRRHHGPRCRDGAVASDSTLPAYSPGSYADVRCRRVPRAPPSADVSAAARRSSGQRGPSSPPSLPLHRCRLVMSVYGHWGLPSLFSLSRLTSKCAPWMAASLFHSHQ